MNFDWSAFLSALLGTTIPGLAVSIILVIANNRSSKSIESYKNELSDRLASIQYSLNNQENKAKLWHERRVSSLIEIYQGFVDYTDFLRRQLYVKGSCKESMDPMHDIYRTIVRNNIYLNDDLAKFIGGLHSELLQFWNWAMTIQNERPEGITGDPVQQRLDYEIPQVLERLRVRINAFADPHYPAKNVDT